MTGERRPLPPLHPRAYAELLEVVRVQHDALMAARPYVVAESQLENAGLGPVTGNPAIAILEQLDGAIAEGQEVLT